MTYLGLCACLALAVFFAVSLVASLLTALVWRRAERGLGDVRPGSRAGSLFLLRMLPSAAAVSVVFGVFLPAFLALEPRDTRETIGPGLVALAAIGAALIGIGAARAWRASHSTRKLVKTWLETARPVDLPGIALPVFSIEAEFPVVSVEGLLRPRLFISRRVLAECSPGELLAMVRHECGHVASADNLKHLAFRFAFDPLSSTRIGRDLERHWRHASEEAADDFTANASPRSALDLAQALIRVARMAPLAPVALPMPSLYGGDGVERRVRRLLESGPPNCTRTAWALTARALTALPPMLALAALVQPRLLRGVHDVIEVVVRTLS